jgi:hypothetical protein
MFKFFLYCFCTLFITNNVAAQEGSKPDTFFLAKKRGLLGKLGKSIATNAPDDVPQKVSNQFLQYKGKIIRSIEAVSVGFQCSIYDTNQVKYNIGIRMANLFHKNSKQRVLRNDLFFKEGSRLFPYLMADNERYLRDLSYIQDARIIVVPVVNSIDSVDVVVLTKDIFSLGGKLKVDSRDKARVELQEENIGGSAIEVLFNALYDNPRNPQRSYGGSITRRNIGGSFVDWTSGFSNFAPSFSSGRLEENNFFTRIEKPLVTPYIPGTGALELGYYKTSNAYVSDSLYRANFKYENYNIDGWLGYSLDSRRSVYANKEIKVHKFIAIRGFDQHFITAPLKSKDTFDFRFTSNMGMLASINIFRQTFYKTNFIYGFGRNEDVPEGFSATLTTGYAIKQNDGYALKGNIKRPYTGLDFGLTNFRKQGFYSNYTLRFGGFFFRHRFEDVALLFNVDHFTRLKKISPTWYQRTFISTGIASEINPVFNPPLFLNSEFGLPYFNPENINSDLRATIKVESVYYNTKKILGFRFAPFVFSNLSMVKPIKLNLDRSDMYSAFGGGIRARNENMVFGTVELKGYYFPRINGDMRSWKVELNTNIRFKYNSTFIRRPDVIVAN